MKITLPIILFCFASLTLMAEPVKTHPRLLFRVEDLTELRDRMVGSNTVWTAFKQSVVDPMLTDWKCASTWVKNADGSITRLSFTDESGTTHYPTLGDGSPNPNWGDYLYRKAAPEDDTGAHTGIQPLRSELYAMTFAFMARLLKDQPGQEAVRAEYLNAARECLMKVIDPASLGHPAPDANGQYPPFRHPGFSLQDRSFAAEAFGFTVDWIYEDLSAAELAKLRRTFLIWAFDTDHKPFYSPVQPVPGVTLVNDPALLHLNDPGEAVRRSQVRLALNNHYANHTRQLALFAMCFDPKDDVPTDAGDAAAGALTGYTTGPGGVNDWVYQDKGYLRDATGAWLYLTDYAFRNDGAGGLSLEGTQYTSNGLGPMALLMYCLHTAGQDDPQRWGPQVSLHRHPFWDKAIPGYLALLPPTARIHPDQTYLGPHYQPPMSGDEQNYLLVNDQNIKYIAPLALYDERVNGSSGATVQAVRYIQQHLANGGTANFAGRIANTRSEERPRDAIYYFLLFDPEAPAPSDPRLAQPLTFYAQHDPAGKMGMVTSRSDATTSATYFHWRLAWNRIDHQRADSLGFGLWKNGIWFTKIMTGYGALQGSSEFRNNLALKNGATLFPGAGYEAENDHPRGSQWSYGPAADPQILERSLGEKFIHFDADATGLYNYFGKPSQQNILHASRSLVWLKPDHIVIYDRAKSTADGGFKRWCLNMPGTPAISGTTASAVASDGTTPKGRLFVNTLLPAGAAPVAADIEDGDPAPYEDMKARIIVSAPGDPTETRFLHVVQAADLAVLTGDATQLITSTGSAYEGAVIGARCVMFRKTHGINELPLSFTVPPTVTEFVITGLDRFTGYDIANNSGAITITAGTQRHSDGGGVLNFGASEPPNVEMTAVQTVATEGGAPASFTLKRSGDISAALTVNISIEGDAGTADFASLPAGVTFAAGSGTATLTLSAADDAAFEPAESFTLKLLPGAAYHASEAANEIRGSVADNEPPPGGTIAFSSASYTAAEGAGNVATITLTRSGATTGAVSALMTAIDGTALSGSDYSPTNVIVQWANGDSTPKQVNIPLVNDGAIEADETVNLSLSQPTGDSALGLASAVLSIADDEPPTFELTPSSATVSENATGVTFTITRVGGANATVAVSYATANGTAVSPADYTAQSGALTWTPGEPGAKQVTIPLNDDTLYEGASETFTFTISNPTGGGVIISQPTATITINENDPQPAAFHVGPGQSYPTLASVPWSVVGAGSDVFIHYDAAAYHEKLLISNRGTDALPIRIIGVKGAGGERPIIDGNNAAPPPLSTPYHSETSGASEDEGLIVIERANGMSSSFKPGYIEISGIELKNAHPDNSYTRQTGGAADAWSAGGGAIYLRGAEHVTVRDCVIHHCSNGIVTNQGGGEERNLVRDLVITHCNLHSNGKSGNYYGRNLETQAAGVTLQFCRLDEPLSGSNVENVRDLSAGFIARCNYISGGGAQFNFDEPYGNVPLLTADPNWGVTHVWGNVLRNFGNGSGNVIHFGGSQLTGARVLHFHHNTVHCETSYSRNVLDIREADESAFATNNIMRSVGITEFRLNSGSGSVVFGKNLAQTGYMTQTGASGVANLVSTASMGFIDEAIGDYHLALGSTAIDAAAALPAGAQAATAQYYPNALGVLRHRAGAADDIGAFESVLPVDAWLVTHFSFDAATPAIAGDLADPDADGGNNLLEYALDRDPFVPDAHLLPTAVNEGGFATMNVARNANATDLNFSVEVSDGLANWQSGPSFTTTLINTAAQSKVRDNTAISGASRRFIRLRVSR